jgi:methionyl aminopeptidase
MLNQYVSQRPELKSPREIALMREAGKVVAEALHLARQTAQPGARTADVDQAIESVFAKYGATPLFKGYGSKSPFPAATCISLNEQIVHGIPSNRPLRQGDLVKIDTACKLNGWCADAAICFALGEVRPEIQRMVRVAEETLQLAIREMGRQKWWSDVARLMQQHVQRAGFSVVERFVGHGIGRVMHEPPQVPNFTNKDMQRQDARLVPGLVLAIEPMVNLGRKDVLELPDQWTIITRDRLPSAHVEHTVALTENGVEVLTSIDATVAHP